MSGSDQMSGQQNSWSGPCCPVVIRRCSRVSIHTILSSKEFNIPKTSCSMPRQESISKAYSVRIKRSECLNIDDRRIPIGSKPSIPRAVRPCRTQDILDVAELRVGGRRGCVNDDLRRLQWNGYE